MLLAHATSGLAGLVGRIAQLRAVCRHVACPNLTLLRLARGATGLLLEEVSLVAQGLGPLTGIGLGTASQLELALGCLEALASRLASPVGRCTGIGCRLTRRAELLELLAEPVCFLRRIGQALGEFVGLGLERVALGADVVELSLSCIHLGLQFLGLRVGLGKTALELAGLRLTFGRGGPMTISALVSGLLGP